jgi:hypothetical protein
MKIKILALASVIAFFIASCGGVDKTLVENIDKFEKDWSSFTAEVNKTGDNIKTESDKINKDCDETCSMECSDKKAASMVDSCKDICRMNKTDMADFMKNFDDFKTNKVEKTSTEFAAWKEKVMKGEIKTDAANKDLEAYNGKLGENKDILKEQFVNGLDAIKTSCEASCNAVKEKCAMMDSKDGKKSSM